MNKIVKAENEKIAAIDYATAAETTADGEKRASIKKAEGVRQAKILEAEGDAEAIRLVNDAANKYFVETPNFSKGSTPCKLHSRKIQKWSYPEIRSWSMLSATSREYFRYESRPLNKSRLPKRPLDHHNVRI